MIKIDRDREKIVDQQCTEYTAISHCDIKECSVSDWNSLLTCTILPKLIKKRIVVVVVCIGIFEMDICACMQTYMLYINTKCASGVCTQDANGIDRFTIIKSTYLEK